MDVAQQRLHLRRASPSAGGWAGARARERQTIWCWGVAALVPLLTFGFGLGGLSITTPNEGLYGQIAREMIERHDWVVPHINSVLYFEKPPLLYWLCALCMSILGVTPLAARLPSALGGILLAWLIFWLGSRQYSLRVGTYAALVLATSIGFVLMARQVMFDALLTTWMTASIVSFWVATTPNGGTGSSVGEPVSEPSSDENIRQRQNRELTGEASIENAASLVQDGGRRSNLIYVTYAALALAVLTKGLIGLLLPFLTLLAYAAVTRDWQRLRALRHSGGIALFIALAAPWHILMALRHREWVWFYFVNEHILRFLGRRQPKDYWTGNLLTPSCGFCVLLLPWSIFLPALCARLFTLFRTRFPTRFRGARHPQELSAELSQGKLSQGGDSLPVRDAAWEQATLFNLCWFLVPLLFFTVSRTRTLYYLLPVLPPLALLLGDFWGHANSAWTNPAWPEARQRRWLAVSLAVALVIGSLVWLWCCTQIGSASLRAGRLTLVAISLYWLLLGMTATLTAVKRSTLNAAFACFTAATLVTTLVAVGVAAYAGDRCPTIDAEQPLASAIANVQPPAGTLVAMGDRLENHSAFVFYLPQRLRPILIVNGQRGGDLEFGSRFPNVHHLFISYDDLNQLAQQRPLFLLTNLPCRHHLAATLHPFYRSGKTMLWTNLPLNKK
ncbi:MAG: glycosyltransferase family 39 protein [Abitibacteriaceae bacterium]|nr:glycosyltransferase family 39 protein [Abditibacteriaceae bacterium]